MARIAPWTRSFSFYGPIAYDLGTLWGHVLIALARAHALRRPASVVEGIRGLLGASWRAFVAEFEALWPQRIDRSFTDGFRARWLGAVFVDALGFAACEANRRVICIGHVNDLEQLDGAAKAAACAGGLQASHAWLTMGDHGADADAAMAVAEAAIVRETG
jgi:5-methylthioribose kinase